MKRIETLDMLRGFALVSIMIDHFPGSALHRVTLVNFALFDAAELFVVLSGFLVGLVWLSVSTQHGTFAAQKRFAIRAFQVWRALIIGGVLMALLSAALMAANLPHTAIWTGYGEMIVNDPLDYLVKLGSLWMQPNLLDVLSMYVVMIAAVPLVMPLLARQPLVFATLSFVVWWFAVPLNSLLPTERAEGGLLFNPFGWQALFFIGAAMGYYRKPLMEKLRPWSAVLTFAAAVILIFGLVLQYALRHGVEWKPVADALWQFTGPMDKWSMDFARLLSTVAAAWIVAGPLSGALATIAGSAGGRGLSDIGRGGLVTFIACVLLSILADAVATAWNGPNFLIDLAIIVLLWLVAVLPTSGPMLKRLATR
ncbi:OpgC domain-containing protein [Paracoccus pacificus]|uniref:OpgC domain-containing protein n=1 Tax=Paracoccus pacificus TaxID=1463598 RepID=A0ABW4R6Q4_9RHOB